MKFNFRMVTNDTHNDDIVYGNGLGAIGTIGTGQHQHQHQQQNQQHTNASNEHHNENNFGALSLTPSTSPQTNSSTSPQCIIPSNVVGILCGRCDSYALCRCLDCNDVLCDDCVEMHLNVEFSKNHCIVSLNAGTPPQTANNMAIQVPNGGIGLGNMVIGSVGSGIIPMNVCQTPNNIREPHCDVHGEILRYVCMSCKKIVCQECTLWEHKEHNCITITSFAEDSKDKLLTAIDSGKLGTKYIKASIDRAVQYSQSIERDVNETVSRIRKSMRYFIVAIEDRERSLIENVEKLRQTKLSCLSDQMAGLRSALAGLSKVSDQLTKAADSCYTMSHIELAQVITRGENQMEQFAAMYKNLQPKEEYISYIPPNYDVAHDIREQGEVIITAQRLGNVPIPSTVLSPVLPINNGGNGSANGNILTRRPIVRGKGLNDLFTP